MAVPCLVGPQESLTGIENLFLSWVPINVKKGLKAKLESAYSFMLKHSKITVWHWCCGTRFTLEQAQCCLDSRSLIGGWSNPVGALWLPCILGLVHKSPVPLMLPDIIHNRTNKYASCFTFWTLEYTLLK